MGSVSVLAARPAASSFPHPGERVRLLPGCRTSAGTAASHDVGEVVGRLGQSTLVVVRMDTDSDYRRRIDAIRAARLARRGEVAEPRRTLVVEAANVVSDLITEAELRALWGDR